MSRRTERPYKVDGADKLAQHSDVRCSVPEINGPVVQREFTSLLRETCKRAPSETAGARVSNGPRAVAGVSRGRGPEGNEPGNTGGPHNSGRAELGRQNTTIGGLDPGALKPTGRASGSDHRGRERVLPRPGGLPGTAGRGPACTVVWEAGGETLPPTRFDLFLMVLNSPLRDWSTRLRCIESKRPPGHYCCKPLGSGCVQPGTACINHRLARAYNAEPR